MGAAWMELFRSSKGSSSASNSAHSGLPLRGVFAAVASPLFILSTSSGSSSSSPAPAAHPRLSRRPHQLAVRPPPPCSRGRAHRRQTDEWTSGLMRSGSGLGPSPSVSVGDRRSCDLSREFALTEEWLLGGAPKHNAKGRGAPSIRGPPGGVSPAKRQRSRPVLEGAAATAASTSAADDNEGERWRLLEQLSQVIPTAGSLLRGAGGAPGREEGPLEGASKAAASEPLDWEACSRALDRLVSMSRPAEKDRTLGEGPPLGGSADLSLFSLPGEQRKEGALGGSLMDVAKDLFEASSDPLESLIGGPPALSKGPPLLAPVKRSSSGSVQDPMKERQRRELQQKRTLDLAAQIVSRFKGSRRPGVLQLLHRFFSCSARQVRDPQQLEKLVGSCCYIIARQHGDDMSLHDVTAQLEKREGTKGRQRCRCISKWVVKVCGKLQLRCLPRHRDAEAMASNALRRICCHLKLLLTRQEQQEQLLLQALKNAYRQCIEEEKAAASSSSSSSSQQHQEATGDPALAELDDEDLLRLLLLQQQEDPAAAAAAAALEEGKSVGDEAAEDKLPDVEAFLKQFDSDCNAKKEEAEKQEGLQQQKAKDPAAAAAAAAADPVVCLGADGSLQLTLAAASEGRASERPAAAAAAGTLEDDLLGPLDEGLLVAAEGVDPAALDAQIQQHECVLRLLRLLPSAQRIKLDHSIWLQRQRKLALQQLCEQSSLVIKCVSLLQQLTALAFACSAAKNGYHQGPGGLQQQLPTVSTSSSSNSSSGSCSCSGREAETTQAETPQEKTRLSPVSAEGEDPLDENWQQQLLLFVLQQQQLLVFELPRLQLLLRACGRCDAITTAAHFVIVFEGLQEAARRWSLAAATTTAAAAATAAAGVPVFQRVVLEALNVDRRSVYKRRREQLHLLMNIFRRVSDIGEVHAKNLGSLLVKAVNDAKVTEEVLRIAETEPLPSPVEGSEDSSTPPDEKCSGQEIQTTGSVNGQSSSGSSREDGSSSGRDLMDCLGGEGPLLSVEATKARPAALSAVALSQVDDVLSEADATINSAAAAAAALRELEEVDPALAETPMARVVSLQYERTQQRWVCKWREGVGTGGRWHRRCFSVVKYGEDGAHTLAAAVAKKLRDRRSQENGGAGGGRHGGSSSSHADGSSGLHFSGHPTTKRMSRAAAGGHSSEGISKARNSKRAAAGGGGGPLFAGGAAALRKGGGPSSSSYLNEGRGALQTEEELLATLPVDAALSSVVASAAYSDEMERLAQLLHKARSNPLLARWLDERAPPPSAAALRAAAESLVPYLSFQTAAEEKAPAAAAAFKAQQQPLPRRGRVAGAREGM
ncbi:hypothetical protein Emed_001302 [Eimeria media]